MAIVNTNIIKEWFRNLKKPTEDQFWAWLDSFRHKLDPVPMSDVENLTTTLQKKADLIGGVIPESQLPFSVVTSEVIALGKVEIVGSTLTLKVHSSGSNRVRVKGQEIVRTFPNAWDFTALQNGGVKVLRGYAIKGETDFFVVEGPELPEYEKPEIPLGALQLFEATITEQGSSIDTGEGGVKTRADDAWKTILLNRDTPRMLYMDEAGSNFILEGNYAATITGVVAKTDAYIWEGKPFIIRNNTGNDIQLNSASLTPEANIVQLLFASSAVLKRNMDALVMVCSGALVVVRFGGGGGNAEFPEGGEAGDPLVRSAGGGVEFSGAIRAALDAEIVNRAADDLKEKNERTAADNAEALTRANADALKLDKPPAPNNTPDRAMLADGGTKLLSEIALDKTGLVNKMGVYYDSTLGKFFSNGIEWLKSGFLKVTSIILTPNGGTALPNELGTDGTRLWFGITKKPVAYVADIPAEVPTVFFKAISTTVTELTLSQLNSFGTDRVDAPNLDKIYFKNGGKWTSITTTNVV